MLRWFDSRPSANGVVVPRATVKSVLPSPSKSAFASTGTAAPVTVSDADAIAPVSALQPSVSRSVHVPFALATPAKAVLMLVGGIGFVAPAPPLFVVRYVPVAIATVAAAAVACCHQPPLGGAGAVSEKIYGPAPRSVESPNAVDVVARVRPKIVCDAPFGAIKTAVTSPM